MVGRQARVVALIHCRVRSFDMSREQLGFEQRSGKPVLCELMSNQRELGWISRQFYRRFLILFRSLRDQFRKANGI